MISKFLAFLNNLLPRSRTRQQWERILEKQLEIKQSAEQVLPLQKKKSTRRFPYNTARFGRSMLPMLVPQKSILLWKDPVDTSGVESPTHLSLLFDYQYDGTSFVVALRRPISEPFVETAMKIDWKIQKMIASGSFKSPKATSSAPHPSEAVFSIEAPNVKDKVDTLTIQDVLDTEQSLLLDGESYVVIHEPMDIASISCAVKPIAGCPIYPTVDFRQGQEKAKPVFHWYVYVAQPNDEEPGLRPKNLSHEAITLLDGHSRRFSVTNCEFRWSGDSYVPSSIDSGRYLLIVADLGPEAIVKCGLSKFPVEAVDEALIYEDNVAWCAHLKPAECIRVVSYNILADLYMDLSMPQEALFFPYCPKNYQMYEYRYPLLLRELASYEMDLCFLQEVDNRMQMRYLSPLFESIGLEMCFGRKQKEVTEGSVIAFCREKFENGECVSSCWGRFPLWDEYWFDVHFSVNHEFFTSEDVSQKFLGYMMCFFNAELHGLPHITWVEYGTCGVMSSKKLLRIFLREAPQTPYFVQWRVQAYSAILPLKPNVTVLRDKCSSDLLVCGNTHLHHNPNHEHLKAFQAVLAVRQLDSVRKQFAASYPRSKTRLLFAGDFNSTPDGSVYELLSKGVLSKSSGCWMLDEDLVPRDIMLLPSGAGLRNLTGTGVTNYTKFKSADGAEHGFAGCLDYIWSDSDLTVHRLAPRPSLEVLTKYEAIPSKVAPSDHIPLLCELIFDKD